MTAQSPFLEFEFPSLPEKINLIESLVEDLKVELNLTEELEANILVSLSEAVNNAILHGNKLDPTKMVKLKMLKNPGEIIFYVEDEGPGFDEKEIKDPTAVENLDKPTGRGIFLMRNLADQVEFKENGRIVIISFRQN
jgi:serine/threonine-protein kinase RsbW